MALNQAERGLPDFRKATELDPRSAAAHANLGFALYALERHQDAEEAAREALEIESESPPAHLLLASVLSAKGATSAEALHSCRRAAERFPRAHLLAARLLASRGARQDAAAEVRRYLRFTCRQHRRTAEVWLKSPVQETSPATGGVSP